MPLMKNSPATPPSTNAHLSVLPPSLVSVNYLVKKTPAGTMLIDALRSNMAVTMYVKPTQYIFPYTL